MNEWMLLFHFVQSRLFHCGDEKWMLSHSAFTICFVDDAVAGAVYSCYSWCECGKKNNNNNKLVLFEYSQLLDAQLTIIIYSKRNEVRITQTAAATIERAHGNSAVCTTCKGNTYIVCLYLILLPGFHFICARQILEYIVERVNDRSAIFVDRWKEASSNFLAIHDVKIFFLLLLKLRLIRVICRAIYEKNDNHH